MKKRKRQLACLILALCTLFSCVMPQFVASAAEGDWYYYFKLSEKLYGSTDYSLSSGAAFGKGETQNFGPLNADTTNTQTVTLPRAELEGFGFDGWSYDSGYSSYSIDPVIQEITDTVAKGRSYYNSEESCDTLYPVFKKTVTWDFQNDAETNSSFTEYIYFGHSSYESGYYANRKDIKTGFPSIGEVKKDNFVFSHWSDEADGEDVFFADNKYLITGASVTLYAVWKSAPMFDPNGGTWATGTDAIAGTADLLGNYTAPATNPTYTDREFMGWFDTQYSCDAVPQDAVAATSFELDKTYYAGWKSKSYGLEYINVFPDITNPNPASYKKTAVESTPLTLANLEKEGYDFLGWYLTHENDGLTPEGTAVTEINAQTTTYDPCKLYAGWSYKLKDENVTGRVNSEINHTLALQLESLGNATFSLPSGFTLPEGLTFDPATSTISGTPTREFSGRVRFDVTLTGTTPGITISGAWVNIDITSESSGGSSVRRYNVSFDTNGAGSIPTQRVIKNSRVTEPKAPVKDDFDFAGWYTDNKLENPYDFDKKVTKSFTLYAKWTEADSDNDDRDDGNNNNNGTDDNDGDNSNGGNRTYDDVSNDDWFYDDVQFVINNNLISGASGKSFAPNQNITRADFVTALYRLEGSPKVSGTVPFTDVAPNSECANAALWANQNGIINGITATTFAPNEKITREQIATVILRYANFKGVSSEADTERTLTYADADKISDWALAGVKYCLNKGIMQGKSNSAFAPAEGATRAEAAAIIKRTANATK